MYKLWFKRKDKHHCFVLVSVPTVSYNSPQMHLHGKTQYSIEYVDKSAVLKVGLKVIRFES